ncbi:hypothetical protein WKI13_02210 [Teredinibacter turnerae]|uniref:hypothetical protein n=1 Tax=Teredinibacter turnerae TaxID=2426 RepID=UPI000368E942|nr:hypothetical protein [Teredinibacter turnerae]
MGSLEEGLKKAIPAGATKPDEAYLQRSVTQPMAAFFLNMPIKELTQWNVSVFSTAKVPDFLHLQMSPQQYDFKNTGVLENMHILYSFPMRRVFLYLFAKAFDEGSNAPIILSQDTEQKSKLLRRFGYNYNKSAMGKGHPFIKSQPILFLSALLFNFENVATGHKLGINHNGTKFNFCSSSLVVTLQQLLTLIKEYNADDYNSFLKSLVQSGIDVRETTYLSNPYFAFSYAGIPVYWPDVLTTNKKSDFWNLYVFLTDMLYRMPELTAYQISWEDLWLTFGRRGTLVKFKHNFRRLLEEVYEIYPEAIDKVDFREKKSVYFFSAKMPRHDRPSRME